MPRKPMVATAVRRRPGLAPSSSTASGIMNSGRENCSAMASASSMLVMVQKKQALPMERIAPEQRQHEQEADGGAEEQDLHRRQIVAQMLDERRHHHQRQ